MQLFNFYKNKKVSFILLLAVLVIILTGFIYYINFTDRQVSNTAVGNNLIGYREFRQKTNQLVAQNPLIAKAPFFTRFINALSIVEDKNSADENKYKALTDADKFLQSLYADTNNHKLYILHDDLASFTDKNFPKLYKKRDFAINCMDSICADSKQPEQITGIIEQLKQSDFPKDVKNSAIKDIINTGYYSNKDLLTKAANYLILASIINSYSSFTTTGANLKISDSLYNFVKSYYPEQFEKLIKTPAATSSGLVRQGDY